MKTKLFLMGILSFALVFGFIGCGGDDDKSSTPSPQTPGTPPSVGSLPSLPTGVTAVTADDVDDLLEAVKESGIVKAMDDAIDKIEKGNSLSDEEKEKFKVTMTTSSSKAIALKDVEDSDKSVTVLKDSYFESSIKSSPGSELTQHIVALTAKTSEKAAKIILDVQKSSVRSGETKTKTYSGSLKVYGDDNETAVKEILVEGDTEENARNSANEALGKIGIGNKFFP